MWILDTRPGRCTNPQTSVRPGTGHSPSSSLSLVVLDVGSVLQVAYGGDNLVLLQINSDTDWVCGFGGPDGLIHGGSTAHRRTSNANTR